jgi:hypothetical protein
MPDSVYCWDCGFQSPVQLYPQKDDLRGLYKKAFDKIWGVLEDSGWLLTQPGDEAGEVQMVCVPFLLMTIMHLLMSMTKVFSSSYHSSAVNFAYS